MGRKAERFIIEDGKIKKIKCSRCKEWKSPSCYHTSKTRVYSAVCRDCNKELQKIMYIKKKEKKAKEEVIINKAYIDDEYDEHNQEYKDPHIYEGKYILINPQLRKNSPKI